MKFSKEMVEAGAQLKSLGYEAVIPLNAERNANDYISSDEESAQRKITNNSIYGHYVEITNADAVLVLNYDKNDIKNYIGANTFLEMGYAHVLNKPVYVLNPLPEQAYIKDELKAFSPIIINGNLSNIK